MRFDQVFACLLAMLLALGPAACCCVWSAVGHASGLVSAEVCAAASDPAAGGCPHCCVAAAPAAEEDASCCRTGAAGSACDSTERCECWFCLDETAVLVDGRAPLGGDSTFLADLFPTFPSNLFGDAFAADGFALVRPPTGCDRSPTLLASTGRDWLPWGCVWRC